jgi:mono/diheme cytochrome c family protein
MTPGPPGRRLRLGVGTFVAVLAFPWAAAAQGAAANAESGKAVWALGNTSCRNCHGGAGEGAFGPPLAGRHLTYERFRDYVRKPAGRMPSYIDSELTDQEIADLVAYFDGLPAVKQPGPWRVELPAGAPRGQQLAISVIGCAQCHLATLVTPRHGAAEVNGDWDWFKRMVYEHTSAQWEQWKQYDPSMTPTTPLPAGPPGRNRIRMGNYTRERLPEPLLREMWDWAMDLGILVPLTGRITPGSKTSAGMSYTVQVTNAGVKGKGLTAEDLTVEIAGDGKTVATWQLPRLAAGERHQFTVTLAAPAAALKGTIRWARPAVKADAEVEF